MNNMQDRSGHQSNPFEDREVFDFDEFYQLRAKILGILIRSARQQSNRSVEDCARLLEVPAQQFQQWEEGELVPDLPTLELLSYFTQVPLAHFWKQEITSEDVTPRTTASQQYRMVRQRMIGAMLQTAREDANMSVLDVSNYANISEQKIRSYELGVAEVPMTELMVFANTYHKPISFFLEQESSVGMTLHLRQEWGRWGEMDDETRTFILDDANVSFLKFARLLSLLPSDQLETITQGLLRLTDNDTLSL